MTPEQEQDSPLPEDNVLRELDQIDGSLADELSDDTRISSGIPEDQRGSDLDFIQMSGLTSPWAEQPIQDELDPSQPVSFYEKGVADVDSSMAPGIVEDDSEAGQDVELPADEEEPVMRLRDMLASQREGDEPESLQEGLMRVDCVVAASRMLSSCALPELRFGRARQELNRSRRSDRN